MKFIRELKPYIRPYVPLIVCSALLAIPLSALRLSPAPLVKYLVDDLLVSKDRSMLMLFPALLIGIYVTNFVVRFTHYYLMRIVITRVNQRIKSDLMGHLMGLSADYFTEKSTGSLISRVGSDPNIVDQGIGNIHTAIREPITFFSLFGYAAYLNWKLTLLVLAIFPILAWIFTITGRHLNRYITRITEQNAAIFSSLQEAFSGIRVIKAFRLEGYLKRKFDHSVNDFSRIVLKTAAMEEASHPLVEVVTGVAIAAVIFFGGTEVLQGNMSTGDLLGFFAAFALMMDPIRRMNDINIKFSHANAASRRITEVLSWKSRISEPEQPRPLTELKDSIRFENVRFSYPDAPEREVLRGVSFEVKKGAVVAVVGQSGAGKSSLISLLPRIFDVTDGGIKIDGSDIREYSTEDLRDNIAVVSQDVFLFNDTIEENIRCGRLDATHEDIREAARRAHALEFIEHSPQGFSTVIGDRGQKLSGGERQRLSIARAFLRHSPILILDEATSNLDTKSEIAVQDALNQLMKDRTAIVIAHRLSTIRNADQIVVLKNGVIVERGTHDELFRLNGEYAQLKQLNTEPVH